MVTAHICGGALAELAGGRRGVFDVVGHQLIGSERGHGGGRQRGMRDVEVAGVEPVAVEKGVDVQHTRFLFVHLLLLHHYRRSLSLILQLAIWNGGGHLRGDALLSVDRRVGKRPHGRLERGDERFAGRRHLVVDDGGGVLSSVSVYVFVELH